MSAQPGLLFPVRFLLLARATNRECCRVQILVSALMGSPGTAHRWGRWSCGLTGNGSPLSFSLGCDGSRSALKIGSSRPPGTLVPSPPARGDAAPAGGTAAALLRRNGSTCPARRARSIETDRPQLVRRCVERRYRAVDQGVRSSDEAKERVEVALHPPAGTLPHWHRQHGNSIYY